MASKKLMEQRALAKAAERAAAEEWICSRCAATNVGTDVFCMNVIKSGARCMRGGAARWCRGVTFACVCVCGQDHARWARLAARRRECAAPTSRGCSTPTFPAQHATCSAPPAMWRR